MPLFVLSSCGINQEVMKSSNASTAINGSVAPQTVNLETNLGGEIQRLERRLLSKKSIPNNTADLILGLNEFTNRDFIKANIHFQHALKFDPLNAALHKLNALSHHMRGDQGDPEQYGLAGAGYDLAKRYDPGDSSIDYFQGVMNYSQSNFRSAQDHFAQAISINGMDAKYYLGLAASSYYLGELDRAYLNVTKAKKMQPLDFYNVQASGMVHAAMGAFDKAASETNIAFVEAGGSKQNQTFLKSRIEDWENFYQTNNIKSDEDFEIIMAQSGSTFGGTDDAYNSAIDPDLSNSELTKDSDGFSDGDETAEDKKDKKENLDMALIDVAIISSEEVYRSSKGVNLLNGLTLFYDFAGGNSQMASSGRGDKLGVGVGGVGLNYALNIFSDAFDRNKILARPSLVVQNGKNSAFFSGETMHVVLEGGDGAGSIEDIDTGIRLDVVAEFEDSDTITLEVMAERTGLEADLTAVSNSLGSPHFAKTVKTKVLGNLTLRFGETMVLSGLNEQIKGATDDKVPFLGDVPVVQYLFRNNVKVASKKSVLILLTPRRASLTDQQGEVVGQAAQYTSNNLRDLERNVPWMKPAPNLRAIVDHLGRYKYFNQFRKGDIVLKNWATENTLNDIAGKTLDYLYIKYAS